MNRITAIKDKEVIIISKKNNTLSYQPESSKYLLDILDATTGNYLQDRNTLTYCYYALQNAGYKVELQGELEPIPYEDGVIY